MFIVYIAYGGEFWELTPSDATPNEATLVTVAVETNQPDGTYYWYVEHVGTNDDDFEYAPPSITSRSTFLVNNRNGAFLLPPIRNDGLSEGPEAFLVHVSKTSTDVSVVNTTITIQDTSQAVFYVDAGLDQTLVGQPSANLNGFYSGNVAQVTVDWIQISGDTVLIGNVNSLQSNITLPPGASGIITMRLYVNYGLPGQLYDDVEYYINPQDNMSLLVGASMSSGPESLIYTVSPSIEV